MSKKIANVVRVALYDKYGGKCGYTGKPLDGTWQVDHKTPRCHPVWYQDEEYRIRIAGCANCNDMINLIPSLGIVNHYKRELDVEGFRRYLLKLHIRLLRLPKKTKVPRTQKRKEYMAKVSDAFGITPDKPFDGIFYFEKIKP